MAIEFPKEPNCELCNTEPATFFVHREDEGWCFTGTCDESLGEYPIQIERFFNSPPSTTDWLAHLYEKSWMDWSDFGAMFHRFRKSTNSFEQV